MLSIYYLIIHILEETFSLIQRKINKCPEDTKVWALLPLIAYTIPFISAFLDAKLEQTIFVFFVLTTIFYQKVEKSIKTIKKEWKLRNIEIWLLPFAIPAMIIISLRLVRWEDV